MKTRAAFILVVGLFCAAPVLAEGCIAGRRDKEQPKASSAAPDDPEQKLRQARKRLVELEAKYAILKNVSRAKPVIERDRRGRLKSAWFVFQQNAVPPGKNPAVAKDKPVRDKNPGQRKQADANPPTANDTIQKKWRAIPVPAKFIQRTTDSAAESSSYGERHVEYSGPRKRNRS